MSKKHEWVEDGELYLSHIEAKKRFQVSKTQLNDWAASGKVRTKFQEVARMPHQIGNDPQLELHFYSDSDIRKALAEKE